MAWVNFVWSATPGTPIRESAVELVMETDFKVPRALDVIVAVPDKEYRVKEHKGTLMRVSPEELTTAFIRAVARDIIAKQPDAVLQKWRNFMLSTTCTFVLLSAPMDRYWYALSKRVEIACHRSCYQPDAVEEFTRSTLIRMEHSGQFVYCRILHTGPIKYSVRGGRADTSHVTPWSGGPDHVTPGGPLEEDFDVCDDSD